MPKGAKAKTPQEKLENARKKMQEKIQQLERAAKMNPAELKVEMERLSAAKKAKDVIRAGQKEVRAEITALKDSRVMMLVKIKELQGKLKNPEVTPKKH